MVKKLAEELGQDLDSYKTALSKLSRADLVTIVPVSFLAHQVRAKSFTLLKLLNNLHIGEGWPTRISRLPAAALQR